MGEFPHFPRELGKHISAFRRSDNSQTEPPIFFNRGASIFPMGRSLHRHKSNVKFPRYILGLRFLKAEGEEEASGGLDLMIAYAPLAKQYEVISWNSAREEYDFLLLIILLLKIRYLLFMERPPMLPQNLRRFFPGEGFAWNVIRREALFLPLFPGMNQPAKLV